MEFLTPLWQAIGPWKITLEFLVVLGSLFFGSRVSGLGLGLIPAIGLVILVFIFGLNPGNPPITVMLIIITAVSCAATMQATGSIDWMIMQAERLLRSYPKLITILGPICTWGLTAMVGTGHVVYTLMPIIADIAHRQGIRPERAVAVSSIASQMGITASPVAAATAAFLAQQVEFGTGITMAMILAVSVTATFTGVIVAAIWSTFRGKDLKDDKEYQERFKNPEMHKYMFDTQETMLNRSFTWKAWSPVVIFLCALVFIVILAQFSNLRPMVNGKPAPMTLLIQMILMATAGAILVITKVNPAKIIEGNVFRSGMMAVTVIFGIAWMSNTFFGAHQEDMKIITENIVNYAPWAFAFALFFVSVFINSQGATTLLVMPLGFAAGVSPVILLGMFPAVYGYFFIPNYPSDIAAMNFDRSGTTKIGKYLLNHSFMAPGLIGVVTACLVGFAVANLVITKVL